MLGLKSSCSALLIGALWMGQVACATAQSLPDFTDLVEEVSPAVVNISTTQKPSANAAAQMPNMPDVEGLPPMFRHFFERGLPGIPMDPSEQGPDAENQSLGSGFIISADGYVLTNNHVVEQADEVVVRFSDRRELKAQVVGTDPRTDVALLKVNASNLPKVKIGNSEALKRGEWVVAIGSPFGFDHTITAGIVSAKGRTLPNENYVPFIQTDVAINPGNSGGPLFNLKGEVVGINSQIFTRSGGFMGLSFAIPIDVAMNVVEQIKSQGKVQRGWLGLVVQDVNKDLAESFGLDRPMGALVVEALPNAPGAKAGIRVGDVILNANGHTMDTSSDLPHLMGSLKPGTQVSLEVLRDGHRQNINVTLGILPDDQRQSSRQDAKPEGDPTNPLGVMVASLTDEQKQSLDITNGVSVRQLQKGPAARIGVRQGDIITHLNNQAITSAQQFNDVAANLPTDRSISMRVLRQGRASFITFKLSQ